MKSAPVVIANLESNQRERVRIALEDRGGLAVVDIRITAELTATCGVHSPTKRGLTLHVAQLPALTAALATAEAKARELGLISANSQPSRLAGQCANPRSKPDD